MRWVDTYKRLSILGLIVIGIMLGVVVTRALFILDVTEYGVVYRFGQWMRIAQNPGLHGKWPFEQVIRLSKKLQQSRQVPIESLTTDKKNIVVETLVLWRIADPLQFHQSVATLEQAQARLSDAVIAQTGAVVGTFASSAILATSAQSSEFSTLFARIQQGLTRLARQAYGIEVAEVRMLRVTLPEQNKESVFERMKSERGRIAKALRSAGELEAKKIIAAADREKVQIEMQAYAQARLLKAEGDAQAARIYAEAFGRNSAFYKFTRTLQAYEKILEHDTTLFLPAEAELLSVLNKRPGKGASP